jgi:hypothetical protein
MKLNIIKRCGAVLFAAAITLLTLKSAALAGPGSDRSDNGASISRHGSDDPSNHDRGRGRGRGPGGPGNGNTPTPAPTASPTATPAPTPDDDNDDDDGGLDDDGPGHH